MTTLTGSRTARTSTLCALYCAQGMPWGFVTITLLAYIADRGAGVEETAKITALATLPWSFKALWGVVIDRFTFRPMGRRRPWVILAQLGMGATLLSMILIDDLSAEFKTLAWMVFVHNCFVSLQDVAADALAVDVLRPNERGSVSGLMWASSYVGVAVGGAGMGTVLARFGVQAAFMLQASVLFAILLFPLLIRERAGERLLPWTKGEAVRVDDEDTTGTVIGLVKQLARAFLSRGPGLGLFYSMVASLTVGMLVATNPVFFTQELEWSQESYSQVMGLAGSLAGVAGALIGGFLVDRVGVRAIATVTALLVALACFALGGSDLLRASSSYGYAFILSNEFLISAQTVAGFSLFMRLCKPAVAGTQFTLYMAASNLARVGGAKLVGMLHGQDFGTIYVVMGVAPLLALPLLYGIPQPRRVRG